MASSPTSVYLFAGDSLTEGIYGESYVERVARALYRGEAGLYGDVVNAGRGGDTARSLLARIDGPLQHYRPEWVVLATGCNDVWLPWLSSHSAGWWLWLLYRRLRWNQVPSRDLDEFAATYRALIDRCQTLVGASVLACTVSPIGEQLSSPVNRRLARLNGAIKDVAVDCQVPVADIWQAFVEQIAPLRHPSNYVAGEWLFAWLDRKRLQGKSPDEVSRRRRLCFTFDGIHLNSSGADLWAQTILGALARMQRQPVAVELLAESTSFP
jgi:lysophospholipase L1-like esterase